MGLHPFLHRGRFASLLVTSTGALLLVAALFTWSSLSQPGVSSAAAAASAKACTTSNLDVWLNTSGSGAAGSSYYNLNMTNLSAHSCTLYGYPGVSAVTQTGIQLGSSAARDAVHAPTRVTLTSAQSARGLLTSTSHNTATVIVQISDAENYPASICLPITAAGLRIYPPGQKESTVVPYPFIACAKSGPRFLHVEAVQRYVATQ